MDVIRLQYYWNTGSIPPPDYHEYTIELTQAGGLISFRPDYPEHNPAEWQESFSLSREVFDRLIHSATTLPALEDGGEVAVGGTVEELRLISPSQQVNQRAIDSELGQTLVDQVKKTVPERVWQSLFTRYEAYRDSQHK